MNIEIFGKSLKDEVIGAHYLIGQTDYKFSIEKLFPLVRRLSIQRNIQDQSFYSRLRNDLKIGCIVPPITLAFITENFRNGDEKIFINENIEDGFILDGIQRLSAIFRSFEEINDEKEKKIFLSRPLHLNIIISPSMDRLLYRMITLNNGQKPMSPRHQIDILSETVFDFETLTLKNQAHKARQMGSMKLAIHRSDIVKGYIAYLSNTTAIDNKLIIEDKMDTLIAKKIIESDIGKEKFEFSEILSWIAKISSNSLAAPWFTSSNNLIGFCVAARKDFSYLSKLSPEDMLRYQEKFEDIFSNFDKKKIKVGDYRRKMVAEYFGDLKNLSKESTSDVVLELSQR